MRRHLGRATALGVAARRRKAGNLPLLRTLQELGVATSLEVCLDAADYASYPGSGDWLDTSGNGNDAEPDSVTFVGTVGDLSRHTYFVSGAAGYWYINNVTSIENAHKSNQAFTIFAWVYLADASAQSIEVFVTGAYSDGAVGIGLEAYQGTLEFTLGNGVERERHVPSITLQDGWNFVAVAYSTATGNATFVINGTSEVEDYSGRATPSEAASAEGAAYIFYAGSAADSRESQLGFWDSALSAAELSDIHTKTRTRFGV